MKIRTVKLALSFGIVFVWVFMIATNVCLIGRKTCFPDHKAFKASMIGSLERLSFQLELESWPADYEENARALPEGLNHHIWEKNCVNTIERLCNFPIFPWAPDQRQFTRRTEIVEESSSAAADGHRLFGFLLPDSTDEYQFAVASNGYSEVWLSWNKNWRAARRIAFVRPFDLKTAISKWEFGVSEAQVSSTIHLKAGVRYYFEILYTYGTPNNNSETFLQVAWKRRKESNFKIIEGASLALFKNDSEKEKYKIFDDELPDVISCATRHQKGYQNDHMKPDSTPYLEHTELDKALKKCEYRPSYLLDPAKLKDFKRYQGVRRNLHKTYSFPFSTVDGIVRKKKVANLFHAEEVLDEEEAWSVVYRYMDALQMTYSGRYKLESIRRVEKKQDPQRGGRYLLDLIVSDLITGKNFILAEYVFQPNGTNVSLCYPQGLQWNRTADVYLILTAKNLGRWVQHFIKNVEKIFQETRDEHLHVVIYDFDSPDINLKQTFQRSALSNYRYITKPGNYSRTVAFMEAIELIKNPNAIIVTMDLHLDIGSQLINDIRKHCSKGKMVYAPQIVFLHCGGSSSIPLGIWYHYSFGTIAMYKHDWENFGGFSQDFRDKETWGGEDWDLIDSAVKGGLEIERKRSPCVYHYHHSKEGMW